jgi:predicted HAD superfamily Cof-like phosphohydrolase
MKSNPIIDINSMLNHYGFHHNEMTSQRLQFRLQLLTEEYNELRQSLDDADAAETVDALIDIVVIALGTLQLCNVDIDKAWSTVMAANMAKTRGSKPGRPSDGWDLAKPHDWVAPDHQTNVGILPTLLNHKDLNHEKTICTDL